MHDLRKQLLDIAAAWKHGELTAPEVLDRAEELWDARADWPDYPESSPDSIPIEVLHELSWLNFQLVCDDDVDEIQKFLATPAGQERLGWERWRAYWDSLDFEKRALKLKDDDFYFVSGILNTGNC